MNEFHGLICDFCSSDAPTQKIMCAPFKMGEIAGVPHYSDEAWAACAKCAAMVDTNDWELLANRVADTLPFKVGPAERDGYINYLRGLYQLLKQAKGQVA